MNFEELDKALRSVLLQYMCDPEVIGIIKNNVNTENAFANSVEKTVANHTRQVDTNTEKLIGKIDEILNGQQRIESLLKSVPQNNGNGNKAEDDFENAKVKEDESLGLKSIIEEYKRNKIQLKSQINALEKEISQLRIQSKSALLEKEKIQSEYDSLERQYAVFVNQLKIWNSIKLLNDENKEYLEKLCGSFSVMSVLSLGRDEGKVDQLWSYLRDLAVKGNQAADQIEILARYFEFCIELSNACRDDEEKYCIFDIEPGNEFDMAMCIRAADSKQIGNVSKTIVRGIKDGEKVRFKAIVGVK